MSYFWRVLFGGFDAFLSWLGDTWEWDGTAWAEKTPDTSPSARSGHAMAYDSARGRVVLFGGFNGDSGHDLGDTWEWDGAAWVDRTPAVGPSARLAPAMAYDSARGRVVLFGGAPAFSRPRGDTWEWDGAAWVEKTPATSPSVRIAPAMAYDRARAHVVLFGGLDGSGLCGDTWEWDGTAWVEKTTTTSPSARFNASMAYDSHRARVVLFGGIGVGDRRADTWEWDGTTWVDKTPVTSPSPRAGHAMVYDSVRARVVLFGGSGSSGLEGDDTWEWDGTGWVKVTSATSPSGRHGHAMAYDSARGRAVLFGGADVDNSLRDDTWERTGTVWADNASVTSPSARSGHAMVYDSTRGRVVLFGGDEFHGSGFLGDTWDWDGTVWVQETPPTSPSARYFHAMAYDSARGRVVLFGGEDASGLRGDTWEHDACAVDAECDDTNPCCTLTILSPTGGDTIESGDIFTIRWQAPSAAATVALEYSIDNGNTWKAIATGVDGRSYGWMVPAQASNRRKSRLRITSYDASNTRTGTDVSDVPFRIEVVKVHSPSVGESLSSGTPATITWTTDATLRPVARVRLDYSTNGGATWKSISTLPGNPGSFSWTVPAVSKPRPHCKVRVALQDSSAKGLGKDASDAVFTIHP